jgi:transcription elongation factor GreA
MPNTPMTIEGAEKLREELYTLKSDKRPKIIAAIAEAREHGDLKENAEYHAAREQQSFCEGRINEIENKLADAQIIDVSKISPTGKVIFGTTVELLSLADDKVVTYQIVGDDEANVSMGKISVSSPIARAMMGKAEGDEIVVNAPSGGIEYEIKKVRHV